MVSSFSAATASRTSPAAASAADHRPWRSTNVMRPLAGWMPERRAKTVRPPLRGASARRRPARRRPRARPRGAARRRDRLGSQPRPGPIPSRVPGPDLPPRPCPEHRHRAAPASTLSIAHEQAAVEAMIALSDRLSCSRVRSWMRPLRLDGHLVVHVDVIADTGIGRGALLLRVEAVVVGPVPPRLVVRQLMHSRRWARILCLVHRLVRLVNMAYQ